VLRNYTPGMPQITLNLQSDLDKLAGRLAELSTGGKLNRAIAQAVNNVMFDSRRELREAMESQFNRPTPYTLRANLVKPVQATALGITEGEVYIAGAESPGIRHENFLSPEIYGGGRKVKRYERALQAKGLLPRGYYTVPSKYMKLDVYGNVGASFIVKMLSALGALSPRTNRTERSARKLGKRRQDFFVIMPNDPNFPGRQPGIYRRKGDRGYEIVFIYVSDVNYKPRFKFYETIEAQFDARFARQLDRAITFELNNRRAPDASRS